MTQCINNTARVKHVGEKARNGIRNLCCEGSFQTWCLGYLLSMRKKPPWAVRD